MTETSQDSNVQRKAELLGLSVDQYKALPDWLRASDAELDVETAASELGISADEYSQMPDWLKLSPLEMLSSDKKTLREIGTKSTQEVAAVIDAQLERSGDFSSITDYLKENPRMVIPLINHFSARRDSVHAHVVEMAAASAGLIRQRDNEFGSIARPGRPKS
jgi:hypothetical protein